MPMPIGSELLDAMHSVLQDMEDKAPRCPCGRKRVERWGAGACPGDARVWGGHGCEYNIATPQDFARAAAASLGDADARFELVHEARARADRERRELTDVAAANTRQAVRKAFAFMGAVLGGLLGVAWLAARFWGRQ